MGLDVTAYSHLKPIGKHTESYCDNEDHIEVFAYDCFPQSFRGIPVLGSETGRDGSSFLVGGCYATTPGTETHGFHAGSYGGYNRWRADLARQFNPQDRALANGTDYPTEPDPDKPFYELIWFADNEGSIGPEAARDLLADFREHADAYDPAVAWKDYARGRYQDWMRAFELAAADGIVRFH